MGSHPLKGLNLTVPSGRFQIFCPARSEPGRRSEQGPTGDSFPITGSLVVRIAVLESGQDGDQLLEIRTGFQALGFPSRFRRAKVAEFGRRARFRIWWGNTRGGSSPPFRTIFFNRLERHPTSLNPVKTPTVPKIVPVRRQFQPTRRHLVVPG